MGLNSISCRKEEYFTVHGFEVRAYSFVRDDDVLVSGQVDVDGFRDIWDILKQGSWLRREWYHDSLSSSKLVK
jgi:hypothetical protein